LRALYASWTITDHLKITDHFKDQRSFKFTDHFKDHQSFLRSPIISNITDHFKDYRSF